MEEIIIKSLVTIILIFITPILIVEFLEWKEWRKCKYCKYKFVIGNYSPCYSCRKGSNFERGIKCSDYDYIL